MNSLTFLTKGECTQYFLNGGPLAVIGDYCDEAKAYVIRRIQMAAKVDPTSAHAIWEGRRSRDNAGSVV